MSTTAHVNHGLDIHERAFYPEVRRLTAAERVHVDDMLKLQAPVTSTWDNDKEEVILYDSLALPPTWQLKLHCGKFTEKQSRRDRLEHATKKCKNRRTGPTVPLQQKLLF